MERKEDSSWLLVVSSRVKFRAHWGLKSGKKKEEKGESKVEWIVEGKNRRKEKGERRK